MCDLQIFYHKWCGGEKGVNNTVLKLFDGLIATDDMMIDVKSKNKKNTSTVL